MKRLILIITILLAMCGVAWGDISSGLVGYWPLNQNFMQNATTVSDIGSGGNDGTLVNSPVVGADSTTFDGFLSSQSCNMGNSSVLNVAGSDFTMSAWVTKTSVTGSGTPNYLISKSHASRYGYWLSENNSNLSIGVRDNNGDSYAKSITSVAVNANHNHIVMVRDGNELRAYVNGSQFESAVDITGIAAITIGNSYDFLLATNAKGTYSSCIISDVRIYNRALTPSEVTELYNLGRNSIGNATMEGVGF